MLARDSLAKLKIEKRCSPLARALDFLSFLEHWVWPSRLIVAASLLQFHSDFVKFTNNILSLIELQNNQLLFVQYLKSTVLSMKKALSEAKQKNTKQIFRFKKNKLIF